RPSEPPRRRPPVLPGRAGAAAIARRPGPPPPHPAPPRTPAGFQELAGAEAVLALAGEHGLVAESAEDAVRLALTTPGAGDDFLTVLAERLAVGLAVVVSVVDPELLVLSGGIPTAGGERLRALVQEALARISIPRPEVRCTTVPGSPVLHGALQRALAAAREAAFTTH
ncbi:sugar kinase, partial [Kitasatospora sp. NPDC059571]